MSFTTWAQLTSKGAIACNIHKTNTVGGVTASSWVSTATAAGNPPAPPGSGSAAIPGGTVTGAIPQKGSGTINFPNPKINENPYIVEASIANSLGIASGDNGMIHMLYDKLWHTTIAPFNALGTITVSGAPSYSDRVGGDFSGTLIILESTGTTSATATTITVTYTNQDGVTGRTAMVSPSLATTQTGKWIILGLQEDDTGVQAIETIVIGGTVPTNGGMNVAVVKPKMFGVCRESSSARYDVLGYESCNTKLIGEEALFVATLCNGTSTGLLNAQFNLVYG
jgi:hypothetical protein